MSRKLFLDDIRSPGDVTWITLHEGPYDIVRSFDEFANYIRKHGMVDVISFDNDLGVKSEVVGQINGSLRKLQQQIDDQDFDAAQQMMTRLNKLLAEVREPEGRDCVKWLVEQVLDGNIAFNPNFRFTVHSMNTIAGPWIKQYLDQFIDNMSH